MVGPREQRPGYFIEKWGIWSSAGRCQLHDIACDACDGGSAAHVLIMAACCIVCAGLGVVRL